METTLLQTIRFFNSKQIGEVVSRKEFLKSVPSTGKFTRDTYRNNLNKFGYIKTISRGKYEIIKQIPESISFKGIDCYFKKNNLQEFLEEIDKILKEKEK